MNSFRREINFWTGTDVNVLNIILFTAEIVRDAAVIGAKRWRNTVRYESEDKNGRHRAKIAAYRELKFRTGNVFDRLDEIVHQVQTEAQVTILAYFLAVTVLRAVNNLVACHFVTLVRDLPCGIQAMLPS